jgi:hypothetical protein
MAVQKSALPKSHNHLTGSHVSLAVFGPCLHSSLCSFGYDNTYVMMQTSTNPVNTTNIRLASATVPTTTPPKTAMLKLPTRRPRLPDCVDSRPA